MNHYIARGIVSLSSQVKWFISETPVGVHERTSMKEHLVRHGSKHKTQERNLSFIRVDAKLLLQFKSLNGLQLFEFSAFLKYVHSCYSVHLVICSCSSWKLWPEHNIVVMAVMKPCCVSLFAVTLFLAVGYCGRRNRSPLLLRFES